LRKNVVLKKVIFKGMEGRVKRGKGVKGITLTKTSQSPRGCKDKEPSGKKETA